MRAASALSILVFGLAIGCFGAADASASLITLSTNSSDATPAAQLDGTLNFSVAGPTLTLTATNTGVDFNINGIWFNGTSAVTSLSLVSATHSVNGDVTAAWTPVEFNSMVDGFGSFDFGLTDGVGATNPNIIHPGENVVFVLTITGVGVVDTDFVDPNGMGYLGAGKFVNGPDDPESPGDEDSAFGATVPEPATLALLALGLGSLVVHGRRRREI